MSIKVFLLLKQLPGFKYIVFIFNWKDYGGFCFAQHLIVFKKWNDFFKNKIEKERERERDVNKLKFNYTLKTNKKLIFDPFSNQTIFINI